MEQGKRILFSPYHLGKIELKNRVVMAPMTRSRAIGNVPNDIMATYYAERASAGLLITEGTSPSPNGLGYSRIPGIYSAEQVAGWKKVTDAVHEKGGKIFVQIMHTGRVTHPLNLPEGAEMVAPSAIASAGQMWTDAQGMLDQPVPKEIPLDAIPALIAEYVHSAKAAIEAGFDGVELHSANGYLPNQFLSKGANQRTDKYGGSHENRNRFVLEVTAAMAAAIGKDRLGIRLSPYNTFNGIVADENEAAQYVALVNGLKEIGICYVHLLNFAIPPAVVTELHTAFGGTLILNGGYDAARAEADLEAGKAELISLGRPFISNPDLVERMVNGASIVEPDQSTFYTPGEKGYTDYPALSAITA